MAADPDPLMSIPAATRAIGLDRTTLGKQVRAGIVRSHAGKVRLSEVLEDRAANIDLGRSKRREGRIDDVEAAPAGGAVCVADEPEADGDGDASPVIVDGKPMPYAEARAMKESYHAWRAKLAWQVDRGDLAPVADMQTFVERVFGTVRERLLAIPGKLPGILSREHVEAVRTELYEAMEELSDPRSIHDAADALARPADDTSDAAEAPPRLNLVEWADRYRRVAQKTSAAPGRWKTRTQPIA